MRVPARHQGLPIMTRKGDEAPQGGSTPAVLALWIRSISAPGNQCSPGCTTLRATSYGQPHTDTSSSAACPSASLRPEHWAGHSEKGV